MYIISLFWTSRLKSIGINVVFSTKLVQIIFDLSTVFNVNFMTHTSMKRENWLTQMRFGYCQQNRNNNLKLQSFEF